MEYISAPMQPPRKLLALVVFATNLARASPAVAQTADELAAGRRLFNEALADEDGKRFGEALDKYQRVQQIRDTAAVRFRIGAVLEALGKPTRAQEAYAGAISVAGKEKSDVDIAREARARIVVLDGRIAHLTLEVPRESYSDAKVAVDDEPVTQENDIRLDPGPHVVTASATGAKPFRARVMLSDGARVEVPIVFESNRVPPPLPPPPSSSPLPTAGMITGIVGGALVAGGIVSFVVRSSAISEIESSCPNGSCPAAREGELTSAHDRAKLTGPLGTALVVTGVAAIGAGITLYFVGRAAARATAIQNGAIITLGANF